MNILPFESNYIEIWGIKGKKPEKTQADMLKKSTDFIQV